MIARALEHNGAKIYILRRRKEILITAAKQNAVRSWILLSISERQAFNISFLDT